MIILIWMQCQDIVYTYETYETLGSLNKTAKEMDISLMKVRKALITR